MSEPTPYRIVVFLKDWEVEATEPMSEDVGRAEFERIRGMIRLIKPGSMRTITIGTNVIVRERDIRRVKLVKFGDEDDVEGEIGDEE